MKKPSSQYSKLEQIVGSLEFNIHELSYLLSGCRPYTPYTLHKIFQYFHQDIELATKLSNAVLLYEDANEPNLERWTALQLAVRFNQHRAVKYAANDSRFDFHGQGGPFGVILKQLNYQQQSLHIHQDLNVSLFIENYEGILPRRMAMQSQTNLKMIRRYEQLQVMQHFHDSEDILIDDDEPNQLKVVGIKNNCKNSKKDMARWGSMSSSVEINNVPTTVAIQNLVDIPFQDMSILRNEQFIERALMRLFNQFDEEYYQCSSMMIILKFAQTLKFNNPEVLQLINQMNIIAPKQQGRPNGQFTMTMKCQEYCKDIKRTLTYAMQEIRYKLKSVPDITSIQDDISIVQLRKVTSNKLIFDIRNYAHFPTLQNQVHTLSRQCYLLYTLLQQPIIRYQSNLLTLLQYEDLQNTLFLQMHMMQSVSDGNENTTSQSRQILNTKL